MKLTEKQKAMLDALDKMPDDEIDYSDIPARPIDWSKARRGVFYRPVKREITLQLDEYVIDWFRDNAAEGEDYWENINQALMDWIWRDKRRSSGAARSQNPKEHPL